VVRITEKRFPTTSQPVHPRKNKDRQRQQNRNPPRTSAELRLPWSQLPAHIGGGSTRQQPCAVFKDGGGGSSGYPPRGKRPKKNPLEQRGGRLKGHRPPNSRRRRESICVTYRTHSVTLIQRDVPWGGRRCGFAIELEGSTGKKEHKENKEQKPRRKGGLERWTQSVDAVRDLNGLQ